MPKRRFICSDGINKKIDVLIDKKLVFQRVVFQTVTRSVSSRKYHQQHYCLAYSKCLNKKYSNGLKLRLQIKISLGRSLKKTPEPGPSRKLTLFYESIRIHLLLTCILSLSNSRFSQMCVTWVTFYATCIGKIIKKAKYNANYEVHAKIVQQYLHLKNRVIIDCTECFKRQRFPFSQNKQVTRRPKGNIDHLNNNFFIILFQKF